MITLLRRIFGFFVSRGFWVLVLVIALSLFTWYAGPQFAFAQHRPLESESMRWRVIGLIFALYFLWILAAFWRRRYLSAWLLERVGELNPRSWTVKESNQTVKGCALYCTGLSPFSFSLMRS